MAFKMKRAGINLRSTTRVAPQLTKYQSSSPLRQEEIEEAKVLSVGGEGNEKVSVLGEGSRGGDPSENTNRTDAGEKFAKCCPRYSKTPYTSTVSGCGNYPCEFSDDDDYNPCASKKPCPDGSPGVPENGKCMCPGDKENFSGEVTGDYTSPGQMQPLTHILNPREMRRNQRMMRIGSDGDERLIKKANKNIRQAIRRGQEPNANDLAIISGQALGNYDGLNMKQDSSGYQDWFTGQQFKSVQTMPGGEMSEPENFNDLVRNKAKSLYEADPSKYPDEASLLEAAEKATERERTILGDGTDDRVKEGKYLNRKTRKLMENRNYDTSNFGEFGKRGKSQKRRDREKRQVTDLRKKANADNISQKEKDRLNRKIRKKGGTPVKMSIELTRPSYKMKGFGK